MRCRSHFQAIDWHRHHERTSSIIILHGFVYITSSIHTLTPDLIFLTCSTSAKRGVPQAKNFCYERVHDYSFGILWGFKFSGAAAVGGRCKQVVVNIVQSTDRCTLQNLGHGTQKCGLRMRALTCVRWDINYEVQNSLDTPRAAGKITCGLCLSSANDPRPAPFLLRKTWHTPPEKDLFCSGGRTAHRQGDTPSQGRACFQFETHTARLRQMGVKPARQYCSVGATGQAWHLDHTRISIMRMKTVERHYRTLGFGAPRRTDLWQKRLTHVIIQTLQRIWNNTVKHYLCHDIPLSLHVCRVIASGKHLLRYTLHSKDLSVPTTAYLSQ